MSAYGASCRSLGAHYEVTAVTALPHSHFALLEYLLHLNVGKKLSVSLLVSLLNSSYCSELTSKSSEALLLSFLSEGIVHIGPLIVLAFCCCKKVLCSGAKLAESLEPKLCVLLLVISGLEEYT